MLPKRKQSDQNSRKIKNEYSMNSKYSKYAVYINVLELDNLSFEWLRYNYIEFVIKVYSLVALE